MEARLPASKRGHFGGENPVPFSVPLKIPLPRISRYLGSPDRGLKLFVSVEYSGRVKVELRLPPQK